jgi:hypothetical protein
MMNMQLYEWVERISEFLDSDLHQIKEEDGEYFTKCGPHLLYLSNNFKKLLDENNLTLWCTYQSDKENDKGTVYLFALEKTDFIRMEMDKNNNITELISWFFDGEIERVVSLKKFASKSLLHAKLSKFIQEHYISNAPNRLDFVTGIK